MNRFVLSREVTRLSRPGFGVSRRWIVRTAMVAMIALFVAACGGGSPGQGTQANATSASPRASGCSSGSTQLTFWSWVPGIQRNVTLFNKTHPGICVSLDDVGSSNTEFEKLSAALKAGSGAPDVVQLQDDSASEFFTSSDLANLDSYGANAVASQFYSFVWKSMKRGPATYCIPQDTGPVAMLYNTAFFSRYHLSVPTTWAQFAQDAKTVHEKNPNAYLTDFPTNDPSWTLSLMAQNGAYPFGALNGSTLPIDINTPAAQAVASYWQPMIDDKTIQSVPDFTTDFFRELGSGTLGVWLTAAWGPDTFSTSLAGPSVGQWRVAPIPQWTAGGHAQTNWSGSCDAVTVQTKNAKAASTFAIWLNTSTASWKLMVSSPTDLYPSLPKIVSSAFFRNTTLPLTGSQKIYKVFSAATSGISTKDYGSPIQTYVYTEYDNDMSSGHEPLAKLLPQLQSQAVSYARQEGLTVAP